MVVDCGVFEGGLLPLVANAPRNMLPVRHLSKRVALMAYPKGPCASVGPAGLRDLYM